MSSAMSSVYDGAALQHCWQDFASRPAATEEDWQERRVVLWDLAPWASQMAGDEFSTQRWLVMRNVTRDEGRTIAPRYIDEWGRSWE